MHGNRTRMRQELEKQRLELEKQREEKEAQRRRDAAVLSQTPSMDVPDNSMGNQVTIEVPTNVLEVRTKLAHPTNFHVNEVKKRQVSNYLSSSLSPAQQSRSAPQQNIRGIQLHPGYLGGMKDPMLSNTVSGGSPMKSSSSLSSNPFNPQISPHSHSSTGMSSPNKGGSMPPQMSGMMFGSQPTVNAVPMTPESPTMMNVDQNPDDIQEQIIEDIMGLEEKFGDTLGLPYMEPTMITPQTLPVSSNLFEQFGGGGGGGGGSSGIGGGVGSSGPGAVVMAQMSTSCPATVKEEQRSGDQSYLGNLDLRVHDKERQKKNNHNMIERRRRFNINDRIKELGSLLPSNEADARQNKGTILKASVDYIRKLQREHDRMKMVELKQRQLEDTNRQMRLRIQELELTARAHQIPTPSLTPDTVKLAEAAEQALGPVTPRSKSPGSANVTPVHMFGTEELTDILRNSPQMDFSKLQIKQERMESPSPSGLDQLSPMQGTGGLATNSGQAVANSGGVANMGLGGHIFSQAQANQRIGDIFSFNLPVSSSTLQMPPQGASNAKVQLFNNT